MAKQKKSGYPAPLRPEHLRLGQGGAVDPAAWFLGPKAENAETLHKLVKKAVESQVESRHAFQPDDPTYLYDGEEASPSYIAGLELLEERFDALTGALKGSLPLASYRNQSHMYWDLTLPSTLGYFAAMLYNQNNVAAEASPVTTHLEIEVGKDLCRMLGFGGDGQPVPWGHITCDGSVANGEAMWAARNLKYQGVAVFQAIQNEPALAAAKSVTVRRANGTRTRLIDLDTWDLLNLPVDEMIGLTARILETTDVNAKALDAALNRHNVQTLGLAEFTQRYLAGRAVAAPVVIAPATAHYSWPKSAALIGLGAAQLKFVTVDLDGRMDMRALRRILDDCLARHAPVIQLVGVVGSTEESAVDPLDAILAARDEYREIGMDFPVHADGAWGGYFASMLREPVVPLPQTFLQSPNLIDKDPDFQLSDYVRQQLAAFARADTVTLDPHKSGFCPYPAGGLCYRNGAMRDLITFTSPVVYHGGTDPTVGPYGIEGSKPGAAPAGVYLSHSVIPADETGYGRLLGRCIFANKRFHAALVAMPRDQDAFKVTVLQRLPSERRDAPEADIAAEIDFIRREIVGLSNEALFLKLDDPDNTKLIDLFKELGADLSILSYAFNFRHAGGWNTDLALMNELNTLIYQRLSLSRFNGGHTPDLDLILTGAQFDPATYGQPFTDHFAHRAGVAPSVDTPIDFLISTTQNPWITETREGDFIPVLMKALRAAVLHAIGEVLRRHDLDPYQEDH